MSSKLMPWACWGEWADVASSLNSTNRHQGMVAAKTRELQALGVDKVAAWRSRGRMPLAADITAALVEARLQDEQLVRHQGSMQQLFHEAASDHALRLAYALPIVRLVNGIADSQQRGRVAASVAVLSQTAGLPHLLVDIRHGATHGELPSLVMLRLGCRLALDWLHANYWDAQAQQLQASYARITHILASLLASCAAAAVKAVAPGPDAGDDAGGSGSGSEEEDEPGSIRQGAGGPSAGLPWLPGLEQLLPGLRMVHAFTPASGPSPSSLSSMDGSSYSAAHGRKQRKELLSQLKALVPQAWAHVLVGPLLDSTALPPPLAVHSAANAAAAALGASCILPSSRSTQAGSCSAEQAEEGRAWVQGSGGWVSEDVMAVLEGRGKLAAVAVQHAGTDSVAQAGRGDGEALAAEMAVAQKAWLACISLVLKAYPALGSMLLHGCIQRLCNSQTSPTTPDALSPHNGGHPSEGPYRHDGGVCGHSSSRCDAWWGALGTLNAAPLLPRGHNSIVEGDVSVNGPHAQPTAAVERLLVLYGWASQLLGPAAQTERGSMRSGRQAKGSSKQQQGAAAFITGPCLPTIHSSLLSPQQLIQLLSDLLQGSPSSSKQEGGTGRGCSDPGSSAACQECRRRLAARLAAELRQHILQAEVQAGQRTGLQGGVGWEEGSSAEDVAELEAAGGECNGLLPGWLRRAQELIGLAQQLPRPPRVLPPTATTLHLTGGAAQPHPRLIPQEQQQQQPCQPHYAGILLPPPHSPAAESKPASEHTALAAAEAQQAELLRRMRSARGGQNVPGAAAAAARAAVALPESTKDGAPAERGPGARASCISGVSLQGQGIATLCTDAQANVSSKKPRVGRSACSADSSAGKALGGRAQEGKGWDGPARHKRWRVAAHWQPCAIGCLPDALQVGGRLPSLAQREPFGAACMPEAACGAAAGEQEEQQQQPLAGPHAQQLQLQEVQEKTNAHHGSLSWWGQETSVEEKAKQVPGMEDTGMMEEEEEEEEEGDGEDGHWQHDPGAWQHKHSQGLLQQAQAGVMYL